uniref:Uncharacterized protein n=1 Tax=Sarcoptes scabiei TaxID=52283 RepID=A0A834R0Z3_SARSC
MVIRHSNPNSVVKQRHRSIKILLCSNIPSSVKKTLLHIHSSVLIHRLHLSNSVAILRIHTTRFVRIQRPLISSPVSIVLLLRFSSLVKKFLECSRKINLSTAIEEPVLMTHRFFGVDSRSSLLKGSIWIRQASPEMMKLNHQYTGSSF